MDLDPDPGGPKTCEDTERHSFNQPSVKDPTSESGSGSRMTKISLGKREKEEKIRVLKKLGRCFSGAGCFSWRSDVLFNETNMNFSYCKSTLNPIG
jgi:hypothetical protein